MSLVICFRITIFFPELIRLLTGRAAELSIADTGCVSMNPRKRPNLRQLARGPPRDGVYGTTFPSGGVPCLGPDDMVTRDWACFAALGEFRLGRLPHDRCHE